MATLDILIYVIGSLFFFSAATFAYYSIKNTRRMSCPIGCKMMSAAAILFIVSAFIGAVELLIFPGSNLAFLQFFTWIVALSFLLVGEILRAYYFKKMYQTSLLRLALKIPHGKFYLFATVLLLFIGTPVFLFEVVIMPSGTLSLASAINVGIWAISFVSLAAGERKYYSSLQPFMVATGIADDKLLRRDIRTFKAYSDLTTKFSSAVVLVTGIEFLREALEHCRARHEVLEDCKIDEDGRLHIENAINTITKMDEKESLRKINDAFSALNCQLLKIYGAATSPVVAKRTFENIYRDVKNRYDTLQTFPEIVKELPNEILENEKMAFLRRKELEQKLREKAARLEQTMSNLEQAELEISENEKKFKTLVSLLPEPVFETDRSGDIKSFNLAGYDIFGYSPKDLEKSLNLFQLLAPEDRERAKKNIEKALAGEKLNGDEYLAIGKDGKKFPIHMRVTPIVYADKPVGLRGIFIDITDHKQLEEVHQKSLVNILKKLKHARPAEMGEPMPERLRRIQMDAIDIIRKELTMGRRPSPMVEEYKYLLAKPLDEPKKKVKKSRRRRVRK